MPQLPTLMRQTVRWIHPRNSSSCFSCFFVTARIVGGGGAVIEGRVNGDLALSRALGDFRHKTARLPSAQQPVSAVADVVRHRRLGDEVVCFFKNKKKHFFSLSLNVAPLPLPYIQNLIQKSLSLVTHFSRMSNSHFSHLSPLNRRLFVCLCVLLSHTHSSLCHTPNYSHTSPAFVSRSSLSLTHHSSHMSHTRSSYISPAVFVSLSRHSCSWHVMVKHEPPKRHRLPVYPHPYAPSPAHSLRTPRSPRYPSPPHHHLTPHTLRAPSTPPRHPRPNPTTPLATPTSSRTPRPPPRPPPPPPRPPPPPPQACGT